MFKCMRGSFVPLYWRTGNFSISLIEIGIHPDTAALYKVTITSPGKVKEVNVAWSTQNLSPIDRIPVFDISSWKKSDKFSDNFIDYPIDFTTILGVNFISILLSPNKAQEIYRIGRLCIGFDENRAICKIEVNQLTENEIKTITHTFWSLEKILNML